MLHQDWSVILTARSDHPPPAPYGGVVFIWCFLTYYILYSISENPEHSSVFCQIFLDFPKQFMYRHQVICEVLPRFRFFITNITIFDNFCCHVTFLNVPQIYSLFFMQFLGVFLDGFISSVDIDNFYNFSSMWIPNIQLTSNLWGLPTHSDTFWHNPTQSDTFQHFPTLSWMCS